MSRQLSPLLNGEAEVLRALADVSIHLEELLGQSYPAYPLLKRCAAGKVFGHDQRLARVRHDFFDDVSASFDLSNAASSAALEKHYFSAYFRKRVGLPFSRWRGLCRSAIAAWLIAQDGASISDAAFEVGYGNSKAITRAFKRDYGVTPRNFAALCRSPTDEGLSSPAAHF